VDGSCVRRQQAWARAILLGLALVAAGCGLADHTAAPGPPVGLKIAIDFGEAGPTSSVDSVDLVIRYSDRDSVLQALDLDDGAVQDTVFIDPGDSVTFVLRAFDADGRLLYVGIEGPMAVTSGATVLLEIRLEPAVLMLRPGPMYQEANLNSEETVEVYVDVHNVDSLFGASFRLMWDPSILQMVAAFVGDFLRGGETGIPTLFFAEINNEAGFAGCTVPRHGDADVIIPGVSGFGCLATFEFAQVRPGTTPIWFSDAEKLRPSLLKPDGNEVDGHESLFLESATVRVIDDGTRH
jgi:hypothetical protein